MHKEINKQINIVKIAIIFVVLFLSYGRAFAGQEIMQQQNESNASLLLKVNQCLNTSALQVVNFQNLKVEYDALIKKQQTTEQELNQTSARLEEEQRINQEKTQQLNHFSDLLGQKKKLGKYSLIILAAIILLSSLLPVTKSLTDYNIVSNNWNKARLLGATVFLVSAILLILMLALFYLIIRIAFF